MCLSNKNKKQSSFVNINKKIRAIYEKVKIFNSIIIKKDSPPRQLSLP